MSRTRQNRPCAVMLTLLAIGAGTVRAQAPPVRLALPAGAGLDGHVYALELRHVVHFGGERAGAELVRDARFRFHFEQGAAVEGARVRTTAVLDSSRASVTSPHGREVLDTRHLAGTSVRGTYLRSGGAPQWEEAGPDIAFGGFGTVSMLALLDPVFPALHRETVRGGDRWEANGTRRQLDGNQWTETPATTRYTLERIETRSGVRVARVAFTTSTSGAASLQSSGYFVIGVDDGVVREVSLEESTSGSWDMGGGAMASYTQATTLRATLVTPSRAGASGARGGRP